MISGRPASSLERWPSQRQPALALWGHGDEFQQEGDVAPGEGRARRSIALGYPPQQPQAVSVLSPFPSAAVVDADGKPLVFVKVGSSYDRSSFRPGASQRRFRSRCT